MFCRSADDAIAYCKYENTEPKRQETVMGREVYTERLDIGEQMFPSMDQLLTSTP
jgi:hypothetical protein